MDIICITDFTTIDDADHHSIRVPDASRAIAVLRIPFASVTEQAFP